MPNFYWRLVRRSFPLLWEALKRGDTMASILTAILGVAGLSWVLQFIPVWVPVSAFGFLFVYGLLAANYEEVRKFGDAKQDLESKLATAKKRKAVKDLLGVAVE